MLTDSLRVLLVEDVLVNARIAMRMLKRGREGAVAVEHKTTLAETVAALDSADFDAILLDLNLPDSSGLATLERVAEVAAEVPVIVLTATESEEIGVRAVQMGAQDFLVKGQFNETALHRSLLYSMERHRLQRTISKLAIMDELTGLYNRRGFNSLYTEILQAGCQPDAHGFLCYFDLDCFKQINDEHGHQTGDQALAEFAAGLRAAFRRDHLLARFGGDEFVAFGIEHASGQVDAILGRLAELLSQRDPASVREFEIEFSVGTTFFSQEQTATIEDLIEAADAALYQNKQQRKRARGLSGGFEERASA